METKTSEGADASLQEKRPKKIIIKMVLGFFIAIFLLGAFFMLKNIAEKNNIWNGGDKTEEGSGTIKSVMPEGIPGETVSKDIGKDGGSVSVTTASGRTAILNVPAGALSGNTAISITPINPHPGGGNNNPDPADEPGIIIAPPNLRFNIPAWVTFTWNTDLVSSGSGAENSYPDFSSMSPGNSESPDLSIYNIPGMSASSGQSDPPGNGRGNAKEAKEEKPSSDASVMVFTDKLGKVSIDPVFGGADGSISGPVDGGGAVQPKNPDRKEGKDLMENAAAKSGGKCSEEFLLAASQMMKNAVTPEEKASYSGAIRDCLDIEWLKNLCENNRIKLRRAYFTQRLPMAETYDPKIADELQKLMEDCVAEYQVNANQGNLQREGNFVMNAKLCGYIDDEWTADIKYKINYSNVIIHQYAGRGSFSLPYTGGAIIQGKADGDHEAYAAGTKIFSTPVRVIPIVGSFSKDNNIIDVMMYNRMIQGKIPITLTSKTCVEQANQPPLVDLK